MTTPDVPHAGDSATPPGAAEPHGTDRAQPRVTERAQLTGTGLLTWLGGGTGTVVNRHDRASYAISGAAVAVFALAAATVVLLTGRAAGWPVAADVVVALLAVLLTGAGARATTTGSGATRADLLTRAGAAAAAGIVVAELATVLLLGGTVDRVLDDQAHRATDSAPAVVAAQSQLDAARGDRAGLQQQLDKAQTDIADALQTARCEYHPTPDCPQTKITGVPGRGPETATDDAMLQDARNRLAAVQGQVPAADQRVADKRDALDQARTAAVGSADRGAGARWLAMNSYTAGHPGGLLLRLADLVAGVLLALLPLLLRRWRGETALDREIAAHTAADRAGRAAETAVAVRRAEAGQEAEFLRVEQELNAARLAAVADKAIDRERQRTRIVAAIGGFEIGLTGAAPRALHEFDSATGTLPGPGPNTLPPHGNSALPSGSPADTLSQEDIVTHPSNLPARLPAGTPVPAYPMLSATAHPDVLPAAKSGGGLELPIIGTVPFTDTAARMIRPLVPNFVTNAIEGAIDTATSPLRTIRQAFEESEEVTFTFRRTRKVTVDGVEQPQPTQQQYAPAFPTQPHPYQLPTAPTGPYSVPSDRIPHPGYQYQDPRYTALTPGQAGYGLPAGVDPNSLTAQQRAELESRGTRELPPGTDHS
ncbi:DUF4407 domain-containing protein [Nocardia stercoris]|uniref:DUF4407 domain-containing protein n=1 Tax=Nocardia stercoris TaxID=2483361 RepID=A0A3M2LAS7_9NOCA|nr:DUF4407 domain-containing protein [Nocardia stercoris]RMI34136.1 DUF4407 domain-containing protein [Nocardia stercoris]